MKVAIFVNEVTMDLCSGRGCFNAFNLKVESFEGYDSNAELVGFTHTGGDLENKIQKLIKNGVEVVHLSSCLRAKHPDYEGLAQKLAQHFKVVGYTHGSEKGKSRNAIYLDKNPTVDNDDSV